MLTPRAGTSSVSSMFPILSRSRSMLVTSRAFKRRPFWVAKKGMVEARSRIAALELQAKQSKAALEGVQKANQELKTRLFGLTKDSSRQRFKGSSPRIQEAQRQINLLTGGNAPPL